MKVKQMLELLKNMNPEKDMLIGPDREGWFYDVAGFDIAPGRIVDGQQTEENDPNPVVLVNMA